MDAARHAGRGVAPGIGEASGDDRSTDVVRAPVRAGDRSGVWAAARRAQAGMDAPVQGDERSRGVCRTGSRAMIAAVFLAAALSSRPEVVAVVERIDGAGMIAHMQDGGIRTYTTVTLSVISPKAYAGRAVQAYCPGPPLIGWEPLLIGQRVPFRLPEKDDNVWLPDLPEFRVWQAPANSPIPILEAKRIFNEAQQASDEDEGKLWGYSLYGPMIFADPKTRIFVRENGTGGELPKDVI